MLRKILSAEFTTIKQDIKKDIFDLKQALEKDINHLEKNINHLEQDINDIKKDINDLNKKIDSLTNFSTNRFKYLESITLKIKNKLKDGDFFKGTGILLEVEEINNEKTYGILTAWHVINHASSKSISISGSSFKLCKGECYADENNDICFIKLPKSIKIHLNSKYSKKIINMDAFKDAVIGKFY